MDTFLSKRKNIADSIVNDIVNKKYQTINICGAPGTGKTYLMDYCISSININYKKIAIIQCKPSVPPVLQGPPKLLERFSKSYRNLQDSWNKSRILGGF